MRIGVPTEVQPGERRVALVPDVVRRLVGAEHDVTIEAGAGVEAAASDDAYTAAGATILWPYTAIGLGFLVVAQLVYALRLRRD